MPLPVILWGAAAALGATGLYKGAKAKEMLDDAEYIGKRAESNFNAIQSELEKDRQSTNNALQELGKLKVNIFSNQIQHLVNAIKKGKSKIAGFDSQISTDKLKQCEQQVLVSLKLESSIGTAAVAGTLAAMGAYGAVGMLGTASTGTAIASLSGAAATNATLAWLGGGSLAAGGFGMAGGAVALGGIVLGPALAIGGFMLASKAEEALTKARNYEAQVDEAVAKIKIAIEGMKAIRTNAALLSKTLIELTQCYDRIKVNDIENRQAFDRMVKLGITIKEILDIQIIDEEGIATIGLDSKISGIKEVAASRLKDKKYIESVTISTKETSNKNHGNGILILLISLYLITIITSIYILPWYVSTGIIFLFSMIINNKSKENKEGFIETAIENIDSPWPLIIFGTALLLYLASWYISIPLIAIAFFLLNKIS